MRGRRAHCAHRRSLPVPFAFGGALSEVLHPAEQQHACYLLKKMLFYIMLYFKVILTLFAIKI